MRLPAHVGIHRAQLGQVVRCVGQHARIRRKRRCFRALFRIGRFLAARLRRCAHEAGKIVEIQPLGHEIGVQQGALAAHGDRGRPAKVAVADEAGEIVVAPRIAVAAEAAIQAIGRRGRRRDADQRKQVFHVLSGEPQAQVEVAQAERIEQRAARVRAGGARGGAQVDAIRPVRLPQRQRRFHPTRNGEGVACPPALALEVDGRGRGVACADAVQGDVEVGAPARIEEHQTPVVDPQAGVADPAFAPALAEDPVAASVGTELQPQPRSCQAYRLEPDLAAEQRPQTHIQFRTVGGCHRARRRPVRVAEAQRIRADRRHAPKVDIQIAGDVEAAPGLPCHEALDGATQPVPLEQHGQHYQRRGQRAKDDGARQRQGMQDRAAAGAVRVVHGVHGWTRGVQAPRNAASAVHVRDTNVQGASTTPGAA